MTGDFQSQPSSELYQHINWIRGFLETMTADNWADNKLHIERQMDSVGQQVAALVKALEEIAGLVDSEAGEPLDDAIRIANKALSHRSAKT